MIPYPAFRSAVHDRRLRKRDLMVLDALLDLLDFEHQRPASRTLVGQRTGMHKSHVGRSLWRLSRCGYVRMVDNGEESLPRFTYSLILERDNPRLAPDKAA